MAEVVVSAMDLEHLGALRKNVNDFLRRAATTYATTPGRLLDIAPQVHEGASSFFADTVIVETLDMDPKAGCTYTGDICSRNGFLPDGAFDYLVCTEVLEHTLRPFDAVDEIWRLLKTGGYLFLTVPFNLRIHGPLPDCWRFTEHGLRAILNRFTIVELTGLPTPGRDLMPIHYTVVAEKRGA
jgi:hypothetical protein